MKHLASARTLTLLQEIAQDIYKKPVLISKDGKRISHAGKTINNLCVKTQGASFNLYDKEI